MMAHLEARLGHWARVGTGYVAETISMNVVIVNCYSIISTCSLSIFNGMELNVSWCKLSI